MNKPITIARQEYLDAIVNLSNESTLPAFAKLEVLRVCTIELERIAKEELQRDTAMYQRSLKEGDKVADGNV